MVETTTRPEGGLIWRKRSHALKARVYRERRAQCRACMDVYCCTSGALQLNITRCPVQGPAQRGRPEEPLAPPPASLASDSTSMAKGGRVATDEAPLSGRKWPEKRCRSCRSNKARRDPALPHVLRLLHPGAGHRQRRGMETTAQMRPKTPAGIGTAPCTLPRSSPRAKE